jgi:Mn2+/Fe2+ NRAMP family transporter
MKIFQIALGIIAALGGFVDIGDLVFNTQAGAAFGYELLWAVVVGVIGIVVFAEMCGRVAAVSHRPVMDTVRERLGVSAGLVTLVASQLINLLTVAAEVGGMAIVLQLLSGLPYRALIVVALFLMVLVIWFIPFEGLERIFGYGGLGLLVFVVVALKLHPDWGEVGSGFVPHVESPGTLLYLYFAVGLISAALMPYEVYFYSSGGVEERWTEKDIGIHRANVFLGYGLGAFLSFALIMTAAGDLFPRGIDPEFLGTVALSVEAQLGVAGLLLALVGMFCAIGGAAIDASLSAAYNMAQFAGWEWGKYRKPGGAPRFTFTWLIFFGLAVAIVMTGVDAVKLTEFSVIFSVVVLPLTYLPILLVARDPTYMGRHVNGLLANVAGWFYFGVIMLVALSAIPLMILTNLGQG